MHPDSLQRSAGDPSMGIGASFLSHWEGIAGQVYHAFHLSDLKIGTMVMSIQRNGHSHKIC